MVVIKSNLAPSHWIWFVKDQELNGMPIALQELPFFADSFEILNDSILIFNGAAFEDQVVLWDYRNKKRINSYLKYTPHYNCRHRGAKPLRRYELLGGISLLSPEYLLSFERCPFHKETPDHYALVSYLIDLSVSQSSALMPLHSNGGYQSPWGHL